MAARRPAPRKTWPELIWPPICQFGRPDFLNRYFRQQQFGAPSRGAAPVFGPCLGCHCQRQALRSSPSPSCWLAQRHANGYWRRRALRPTAQSHHQRKDLTPAGMMAGNPMRKNTSITTEIDAFYSIEDVATLLSVSDKTIRRWIKSGELVAHRIGRQWRISKTDLNTFLRLRRGGL